MTATSNAIAPARNKAVRLIAAIAVLASVGLLAWSASRVVTALGRADAAHTRLTQIQTAATELAALEQRQPSASLGKRPERNLSGQIADALAEAGLPPTTLASLTPEEDAPITAAPSTNGRPTTNSLAYRRQAARLTLEPLTLPDLGRYLSAWRTRQPEWTTSSIQISPIITKDAAATSPSRPIRVTCLIECVYVEQPGTTSSRKESTP